MNKRPLIFVPIDMPLVDTDIGCPIAECCGVLLKPPKLFPTAYQCSRCDEFFLTMPGPCDCGGKGCATCNQESAAEPLACARSDGLGGHFVDIKGIGRLRACDKWHAKLSADAINNKGHTDAHRVGDHCTHPVTCIHPGVTQWVAGGPGSIRCMAESEEMAELIAAAMNEKTLGYPPADPAPTDASPAEASKPGKIAEVTDSPLSTLSLLHVCGVVVARDGEHTLQALADKINTAHDHTGAPPPRQTEPTPSDDRPLIAINIAAMRADADVNLGDVKRIEDYAYMQRLAGHVRTLCEALERARKGTC